MSDQIKLVRRLLLMPLMCFAFISNASGYSGLFNPNEYYRLTTQWQGDGKSLDVVNDGVNNQLQLAKTGNFSGQMWKITSSGNGYYRLTTQWQGDGKSLDVVNDVINNDQLQLAPTGNYSGQHWKITPVGNGYYRLTTEWQGDGKSLDVVNDGANNRLKLANTGNFSGQMWKITALAPPIKNTNSVILGAGQLGAGCASFLTPSEMTSGDVSIAFTNNRASNVMIGWVNFAGNVNVLGTLSPGNTFNDISHPQHRYVVLDGNLNCIGGVRLGITGEHLQIH